MSDTINSGAAPAPASSGLPQEIKTVFNKSSAFRVIYADGVWYEGDQNGNIRLIFFNERGVLPKAVFSKAVQQGTQVALIENKRLVDGNVDREIECEIVMSFGSASQLGTGLAANLDNMKKVIEGNIPEPVVQAMKDVASQIAKGASAKK